MSSDGKADDLAARIGLGSVLLVLLGMFAFVAVDGYRITSTSSVHCVTVGQIQMATNLKDSPLLQTVILDSQGQRFPLQTDVPLNTQGTIKAGDQVRLSLNPDGYVISGKMGC